MARRGCDCPDIITCVCNVAASDCIDIDGTGSSADPFEATPILDPDSDNILTCSASGMAAFLPSYLTNPPAVLAFTPVDQPVANNVLTILFFNRERYDTDSMHSESTNTSRITFATAGVYLISGWVYWSGNAAGERRVNVKINGTSFIAQDERSTNQDDWFSQPYTAVWKFAASDYVEIEVNQNSGADLNVLKGFFSATYVAQG